MSQAYSAILAGFGSQLPEKRLTNEQLSRMVDTSDEWIVQRTGIRERRIAAEGETTASLAAAAARKAIDTAGIEAAQIGLIVCATVTPEMVFPSTACFVGAELGLAGVAAFDMAAACSGFIYALVTAANFVKMGQYSNVLVIGAETLSRITDYTDRASCILFGDGAGAVVLQRSTDPRRGLIHASLHADGSGAEAMKCMPGSRYPLRQALLDEKKQFMQIKGREVYKFAVTKFEELIRQAMCACSLSAEQIKLIVPHQVNRRIIDSALEKLGLSSDKAFVNIDRYGNTSAASIPIALDDAHKAGLLQPGDVVILVAFGGGLTWANAVIRM
jgi:3-oxoacyl-[acyl-carrier-protein] synthase-3